MDNASSSPLILDALSVSYPGRKSAALDAVSWHIEPGTLNAVIGPNGAGKSTLLKAALELIPGRSGKALFWGRPLREVRRKLAYVPQRSAIDWNFPVSALDVVTMGLYAGIGWLRPVRKAHKEKALEAMARLGIEDLAVSQIGALSGGQQQRVFIARALLQDADLYMMDEPFAGVDSVTEAKIFEILQALKQAGKTAVIVHHDLSSVERQFDTALLLNGRTIAQGPVKTVLAKDNLTAAYGSGKLLAL
ncbi:MAG: ABC transporter ATP-binding protein [Alphaproteobacteria bacterium]